MFLQIALFASLAATFVVLVLGIRTFFSQNETSFFKSNRLMRLRVMLQGLTIALFILFLLTQ